MVIKSFWDYIWGSATSSGGAIFIFITGMCGFASYFFVPTIKVPSTYLSAVLCIAFVLIYIVFNTSYAIYEDFLKNLNSRPLRPKVIAARAPSKYYSSYIAVLVTEPTESLPSESIVSIYFLVSEFEELIAIGKVINVQDDKKVHVLITYDHDLQKHRDAIMNNEKEALGKLVLKSAIPSFITSGAFDFG